MKNYKGFYSFIPALFSWTWVKIFSLLHNSELRKVGQKVSLILNAFQVKCPKATHIKVVRYQLHFISQIHQINPSLFPPFPLPMCSTHPDHRVKLSWAPHRDEVVESGTKKIKVMIYLSDIWLWVQRRTCVLSERWSLAGNRDFRRLFFYPPIKGKQQQKRGLTYIHSAAASQRNDRYQAPA